MGDAISRAAWEGKSDILPPENVKPTFDPHLGFKAERKPRVSKLSELEMKALQIPRNRRDYCAHYYMELMMCSWKYLPFQGLCNPETRQYRHCLEEDVVLRMKEYERERRLRIREKKKQKENVGE